MSVRQKPREKAEEGKKRFPLMGVRDKARPLRNFQRPFPFVQLPDGKVQGFGPPPTHSLVASHPPELQLRM